MCTGTPEQYEAGSPESSAATSSLHTAKAWKGSSAFIHHPFPSSGDVAESRTCGSTESAHAMRSAKENCVM